MRVEQTPLEGLLLIKPWVYEDKRGFFMETWRRSAFAEAGLDVDFVQDNHSKSYRHTLRGLHYQIRQPQGKLVRVVVGEVFDVAVDLRRSSGTFGHWYGRKLSAEEKVQMWIPPGFAHGFLVLSESAEFVYRCSDYYAPEYERTLKWDDPEVRVDWPLPKGEIPVVSEKDARGRLLADAEVFE